MQHSVLTIALKALIIAVIVIALSIATVIYLGRQPNTGIAQHHNPLLKTINIMLPKPNVTVTLALYKNNKLVYQHRDPVTETWIRAVFATFLRDPNVDYAWTFEDGSKGGEICTEYYEGNPAPYIELGTGQYTPSHSITALASLWQRQEVKWMTITFNSTTHTYTITYTTTFTVPQGPVTLTEVGLSIKTCGKYLLVAYDTINPGIQLNTTDTLTVQYTLTVKASPPFTQNFYSAMIGYALGAYYMYSKLGQSVNTFLQIKDDNEVAVAIDTGIDQYYSNNRIAETLHATYNTGGQVSDWFSLYHVTNNGLVDIVQSSISFDYQTSLLTYSGQVYQDFKGGVTIYGIAFYLYTDKDGGSGYAGDNILMAYIPFTNPVTVPSYSNLGSQFSMSINIG